MKKTHVLVCITVLILVGAVFIFVGTTSAEPVKFECGITVDVPSGWGHEEGFIKIAHGINVYPLEDKDSGIVILLFPNSVKVKTTEEAAKSLAGDLNGTELQKDEKGTYSFWHNEEKVIVVGIDKVILTKDGRDIGEDEVVVVLLLRGIKDSDKDADKIINSIKWDEIRF